jgi:hypothetical protein
MSQSGKGGAAWNHKTNRADGYDGGETADIDKVPCVTDDDIKIRDEGVYTDVEEDSWGRKQHTDSGVSMGELKRRFTNWADEEINAVLESDEGDVITVGDPHRFASRYRKRQYARLQGLARGVEDDYGKRLHTAMLTLTASNQRDGGYIAPVDHLEELLSSWESVRRELSRAVGDKRWEYIGIIEPHKSGYAHVHIGVFVDGKITESDLEPVINRHIDNCDLAGERAHSDSISVNHSGVERGTEVYNLGAYLASYLGESMPEDASESEDSRWTDDYESRPDHVLRFWATLWVSGRQQFRPSNGAQEYMRHPDDSNESMDDREWELVGVTTKEHIFDLETNEDDIHPVSSGGSGYRRLSLSTRNSPMRSAKLPDIHKPSSR